MVGEFYVSKAVFKERQKKQVGWTGVGVQKRGPGVEMGPHLSPSRVLPAPPCQKGGLGPGPWGRAEERGEGLQAPRKPGPSSGKATAIGASHPTLMLRVTFCSWL